MRRTSLPDASGRERATGLAYGRDFTPCYAGAASRTETKPNGRRVRMIAVTFQCSCGERFTVTDPIFDARVSADVESVECLKCGGRS